MLLSRDNSCTLTFYCPYYRSTHQEHGFESPAPPGHGHVDSVHSYKHPKASLAPPEKRTLWTCLRTPVGCFHKMHDSDRTWLALRSAGFLKCPVIGRFLSLELTTGVKRTPNGHIRFQSKSRAPLGRGGGRERGRDSEAAGTGSHRKSRRTSPARGTGKGSARL